MTVDVKYNVIEVGARYHFERRLVALASVALAADDRTAPVLLVLVLQTNLGLLVTSQGGGKVKLNLLLVLNFKLKSKYDRMLVIVFTSRSQISVFLFFLQLHISAF